MANHTSAIKRNRQRIKRTARNRAAKSNLRTQLKKAHTALAAPSAGSAEQVRAAVSALDRAASKGLIPVERASRVKSRLAVALRKTTTAA